MEQKKHEVLGEEHWLPGTEPERVLFHKVGQAATDQGSQDIGPFETLIILLEAMGSHVSA